MSDKYIIKNCPAYIHRPLSTHDRVCLLGDKVKPNHKELYVYCKDCTDCLLKQIVEKCMEDWEDMATDRFQRELLDLLDIQEVE